MFKKSILMALFGIAIALCSCADKATGCSGVRGTKWQYRLNFSNIQCYIEFADSTVVYGMCGFGDIDKNKYYCEGDSIFFNHKTSSLSHGRPYEVIEKVSCHIEGDQLITYPDHNIFTRVK